MQCSIRFEAVKGDYHYLIGKVLTLIETTGIVVSDCATKLSYFH